MATNTSFTNFKMYVFLGLDATLEQMKSKKKGKMPKYVESD